MAAIEVAGEGAGVCLCVFVVGMMLERLTLRIFFDKEFSLRLLEPLYHLYSFVLFGWHYDDGVELLELVEKKEARVRHKKIPGILVCSIYCTVVCIYSMCAIHRRL